MLIIFQVGGRRTRPSRFEPSSNAGRNQNSRPAPFVTDTQQQVGDNEYGDDDDDSDDNNDNDG